MAVPRMKPHIRPAVLSYGFRPFFLLGSLYAGLSVILWLPQFYGELALHSAFAGLDWHIHEMLFGYLAAIMTGFLLTAMPNWTGRLPLQGKPLLGLVVLWLAGRMATSFSADIGWQAAAVIDCAFLAAVAFASAREIMAGKNWRNFKVLIAVGVMLIANISFHLEAHFAGASDISRRLGIAGAILLIMLIGGRIIPSFTRNWLAQRGAQKLPAPFSRYDIGAIAVSVLALALWVAMPGMIAGAVMAVAALAQAIRLSRWAGEQTFRNPIVLILHIAYSFIPIGFALLGASAFTPQILPGAGIHALSAGAIGTMTLAVMVRATLGHTGQDIIAGRAAIAIFGAVILAVATRIGAVLFPAAGDTLLHLGALLWAAAFLGFALRYGRSLIQPKLGAEAPSC